MEVVRIVMLGMTGVLLGLFLKGTRPEYSVYLSLAAGILIVFYMTSKLSYLFSSVMKIQDYLPLDIEYLSTLLKIIGITYIGQFSSGICKDAGYGSIGAQIEIFTKALYYGFIRAGAPGSYGNHTRFSVMRRKNRQKKTALLFFLLFWGILFSAQPVPAAGKNGASIGEEAGIIPEEEAAAETAKQRSDQGENQAKEGTGDQNEASSGGGTAAGTGGKPGGSSGRTGTGRDAGSGKRTAGGRYLQYPGSIGEDTFGRRGFFHGFPDRNRKKFHIRSSAGRPGSAFSGWRCWWSWRLCSLILLTCFPAVRRERPAFTGIYAPAGSLAPFFRKPERRTVWKSGGSDSFYAGFDAFLFSGSNGSLRTATAMVFYEMVLGVIFLIQTLLLKAVIPGIQAYVIIQLINYLHKEDFLSKLAELLKTAWSGP